MCCVPGISAVCVTHIGQNISMININESYPVVVFTMVRRQCFLDRNTYGTSNAG